MSITTPTEGATATDRFTVTAVAHIDALDGDLGQFMALSVNGAVPTAPNVPCQTVPDPSTCTATWVIDTWSLPLGTITLEVGVLTLDSEAVSDPVHVLLPVHPPIALITSPADASTFVPTRTVPENYRSGMLHIAVQGGQTGVAAGTVASWQLVVDGTATTATATCGTAWTATGFCMADLYWNAALAGPHVLVARLTVGTTMVDSAAITVTVVRPTVAISSPSDGAIIDGSSSIVATGSIATPGDAPVSMGLVVNGLTHLPAKPCPANPTPHGSCTLTLPFDLGFYPGSTTFAVLFLTTQSSGTSAPITVTKYIHRSLFWSDAPGAGRAGTLHTLTGHLRNVNAATSVTLVFTPAVGKPSTREVVTDASGVFTVRLRPRTSTTVTATVPDATTSSAVRALTRIAVLSTPHCPIPSQLRRNDVSLVRCTVPGLPDGIKVGLQLLAHKHWYPLRSGFSKRGVITLPLHWSRRGVLHLRVVVGGGKVYDTTLGQPVALRVL